MVGPSTSPLRGIRRKLFFFLLEKVVFISFPSILLLQSLGKEPFSLSLQRCSEFFQRHVIPLWRVSGIKTRTFLGGTESPVQRPSLGWAQGRDKLISIALDQQMVTERRHASDSEITAAEVNKEPRTSEDSACFWNLSRPLGEAQEESRERK